jgi:orotidine-5'-phosphate decarboxylase
MFARAVLLDNVCMFARKADEANIDGIVCAPTEAHWVRQNIKPGMTINTPAIRPAWAVVKGDDQNPDRIMTPAKAIAAGADRIVVGRPIVRAENPYAAVMRTIEEIARAVPKS